MKVMKNTFNYPQFIHLDPLMGPNVDETTDLVRMPIGQELNIALRFDSDGELYRNLDAPDCMQADDLFVANRTTEGYNPHRRIVE